MVLINPLKDGNMYSRKGQEPKKKTTVFKEDLKMYTVETRIFGKYTETGYGSDWQEAYKRAVNERVNGWLHVRIKAPNGTYTNITEY